MIVVALYSHWWGIGPREEIVERGTIWEPPATATASKDEEALFLIRRYTARRATQAEIDRFHANKDFPVLPGVAA